MGGSFINHYITSDTVSRDIAECPKGISGGISIDTLLIDKLIDISTPTKNGYVIGNAIVVLTNIINKFDDMNVGLLDEYDQLISILLIDATDIEEIVNIVSKEI